MNNEEIGKVYQCLFWNCEANQNKLGRTQNEIL